MDFIQSFKYRRRLKAMSKQQVAEEILLHVARSRKKLESVPQSRDIYDILKDLDELEIIADDLRISS